MNPAGEGLGVSVCVWGGGWAEHHVAGLGLVHGVGLRPWGDCEAGWMEEGWQGGKGESSVSVL